jgi:serine protease Do
MNKTIISAAMLSLVIGTAAIGQTKAVPENDKKESITIRKKADSKEKITIVIDGDKITVNGKPLEELKDADIQVLRKKGIGPLMPRIRAKIAPMMGSMKMLDKYRNVGPVTGPKMAFLGVASQKDEKGAKIVSVTEESAAEKAGLQKDDIITKIGDDHAIKEAEDLSKAVHSYKPGDKITITYLRDGKEKSTAATLGEDNTSSTLIYNFKDEDFNFEMPRQPRIQMLDDFGGAFIRKPRLGLEIQDIEEGKGVKILDVDSDTPGAKAGLQKDDIITAIDGAAINSVDDLKAKGKDWKEGETHKLTYQRKGKIVSTDIKFPKKLKTADL